MTLLDEIRREKRELVQRENGRTNINDLDKLRVDGLVSEELQLRIIEGQDKILALLVQLLEK